jgi:hypothetical protein
MEVAAGFQELIHFKFLEKYLQLYEQLKVLQYTSPYSGGGGVGLFAITRHYMFLIYILGLLGSFVKILFPLYIIPLIIGFRSTLRKQHIFILFLVIFYMTMIYYVLVLRDFIPKRILFTPAYFIYPWIGLGMERLFKFLIDTNSKHKSFVLVFVFFFLILPVGNFANSISKNDPVIHAAGKWLANNSDLRDAKIITNDMRLLFYASRKLKDIGKGVYLGSEKGDIIHQVVQYNYIKMEKAAIAGQMDIMAISVSRKRKILIPDFGNFKKFKEFKGKKDAVLLYAAPKFIQTLNPEGQ